MKYIVLFGIVLAIMGLPVYMLDAYVLPELLSLQQLYSAADERATQLVATP